jgi:hypothetical protein
VPPQGANEISGFFSLHNIRTPGSEGSLQIMFRTPMRRWMGPKWDGSPSLAPCNGGRAVVHSETSELTIDEHKLGGRPEAQGVTGPVTAQNVRLRFTEITTIFFHSDQVTPVEMGRSLGTESCARKDIAYKYPICLAQELIHFLPNRPPCSLRPFFCNEVCDIQVPPTGMQVHVPAPHNLRLVQDLVRSIAE